MTRVDIIIPVYNEEHIIAQSVAHLRDFLRGSVSFDWTIIVADNASTDNTLTVAKSLSERYPDVEYIYISQKGRGRALRKAWLGSSADIVSYMDVDLSTGLEAFPPLIAALEDGYDVAIGSRLISESQIERSLKREITSRGYNLLIKLILFTKFHDAQCGFKAVKRDVVQDIVPLIQNQEWFFDTELLILAEKRGYSIKEIPVRWVEDPDSRVHVMGTIIEDIKGLMRLRFRAPS